MDNGWIKLHRKLIEKGYYRRSQYVHLWVHLLLKANHKPNEFMWNKELIIIKEGQLLTGRKELSRETGISESSIENILKFLKSEHQIKQQKTTKFRIITIINWQNHQVDKKVKHQIGQQSDNRVTTDEQQNDTNKNDKNDKIIKNDKNVIQAKPETQLFNESRNWFINFTKEKINPNYEFSGKEGKNLKSVLAKIKRAGNDASPDELNRAFQFLITQAMKDDWLRERWEISMINSQYNKITNPKNKVGNDWNYIFS